MGFLAALLGSLCNLDTMLIIAASLYTRRAVSTILVAASINLLFVLLAVLSSPHYSYLPIRTLFEVLIALGTRALANRFLKTTAVPQAGGQHSWKRWFWIDSRHWLATCIGLLGAFFISLQIEHISDSIRINNEKLAAKAEAAAEAASKGSTEKYLLSYPSRISGQMFYNTASISKESSGAFRLSVKVLGPCWGEFEATWKEDQKEIVFSNSKDANCKLTASFDQRFDTMTLYENDGCSSWHGYECVFGGIYINRNRVPKEQRVEFKEE